MDRTALGSLMFSYIETYYPGGIKTFNADGGVLIPDPLIDKQVLIFLTKVPEKFRYNLYRLPYLTFKFISTKNYEGVSQETISEQIHNTTLNLLRYYPMIEEILPSGNNFILYLTLSGNLSDNDIRSISRNVLAAIPSLKRGLIECDNKIHLFGDYSEDKPEEIKHEVHTRDTGITEDDILNLVIDLNLNRDIFN